MEGLATRISCETCGVLPHFAVANGFCPACLLQAVLETESDAATGSRIEEYDLLNEVARGGMGIVYRARQRAPSRVVALKMILPSHLNSAAAVTRFRREAEAAASLDHESILPIYSVGEQDGAPFYSMKFAEGGSLATRLPEFQNKPRECAALLARVAGAVAHAHERNILHRDLKPGNILFDAAGKPFVSDFGLARWLENEGDLTQTLAILGTPHYMAPEQASGAHTSATASDIYGLGAILFHLLTNRPPFRGNGAVEILRQAAENPVPRPRSLNPKIPADLETICLKSLEKNPAARYVSAAAFADDLNRFLAGRPIQARRTHPVARAARWVRRNPSWAGFAMVSLALLALLFTSWSNGHAAKPPDGVAVMPFKNLTTDGTNFADGIHEELLVSLGKIQSLKVVSRNSIKDDNADVEQLGRKLGVRAILRGSVQRIGSIVRLNVQLIDATNGQQIWAENFERHVNDAFVLQRDLALRTASALKAKLTPTESDALLRPPTNNSEAYLLYIEANDLAKTLEKRRPDLDRAEQLYERAIQLDPSFALAYAQLAQLEVFYYSMFEQAVPRLQRAKQLAEEAVRLQPELPEAHLALGRYYAHGEATRPNIDYVRGLEEYLIARRGLPNDTEVCLAIGKLLRHLARWNEAIAWFERAAALEPNSLEPWQRLFGTHLMMRNYPAAEHALKQARLIAPNSWLLDWSHAWLDVSWKGDTTALRSLRTPTDKGGETFVMNRVQDYTFLGQYEKAEQSLLNASAEFFGGGPPLPKAFLLGQVYLQAGDEVKARAAYELSRPIVERSLAERPDLPFAHLAMAEVRAALGQKDEAIRLTERAAELLPVEKDAQWGTQVVNSIAEIYAMLGDTERALPLIERSLTLVGGFDLQRMRLDPKWDRLRGDPRFQRLIASQEPRG